MTADACFITDAEMPAGIDEVVAGRGLLAQACPVAALHCFDRVLTRSPGLAAAHAGRGQALLALRRPREALASFDAAIRSGADPESVAQGRWVGAMLLGAYATAWTVCDEVLARRRREDFNRRDQPFHLRHVWDGSSLDGRDVLVRCYHGLGDTIQFLRYLPMLRRRAASVTVQAVPALHGLLCRAPGIDRIVPLGYGLSDPPYGIDIEIMELPYAFRTTLDTIPSRLPYLHVGPCRRAATGQRSRAELRLKVGLAWAAGDWDPRRSIPLTAFAPLASIPGITFVNLQRGPAVAAMAKARPAVPFADGPASWSDDIEDTAAIILTLDLVITVDTMVAHLAGALGRPVWTLLHFAADWRWMIDRRDSPWYPTMRLFRQPAPGAWVPVIAAVADQLRAQQAGTT
ncbi:MAG TPA: ADP-heptose--LPS heptosyltransferase [Alphaproteobacteria bacterium]